MQSKAATVDAYLAELPPDRREAISKIRSVILKNLPKGLEEGMQYGMIGYYVPHSVYPPGYHCDPKQPLPFACLASQKNYMSLYLMTLYVGGGTLEWFQDAWAKAGKKLDMGKCCVRFKRLDDVPLAVIAEIFKRASLKNYIERCSAAASGAARRGTASKARSSQKSSPAKPTVKKPATKKSPAKKSSSPRAPKIRSRDA